MRARLALSSARQTVELREILLREKPVDLVARSAKATVPVLLVNNTVIDESRDIMNWALAKNDPENWLDNINFDLITECDSQFKTALDRYKYANRYTEEPAEKNRNTGARFLAKLNDILARQPHLSGPRNGLTDMAIVTFIRQFANVDRAWFDTQNWPHLRAWLDNFLHSDRFAFIMQKFPVWKPENPPIYFPEQQ